MKIAKLFSNLSLSLGSLSTVLFAFAVVTSNSLRLISVQVPSAVMNSSQVVLVCNYDLQDDQLYSVKWYKNYVEFYRFQPNNNLEQSLSSSAIQIAGRADQVVEFQSKQVFELEGIDPDLSKCNSTHVYLKQVSFATEGTFKCEVSADSPSFATVSLERQMKVYVLPKQKLSIIDNSQLTSSKKAEFAHLKSRQSISNSYALNDFINLTCSSGFSKPAAKLDWFINDTPVINSTKFLLHQSVETRTLKQQLFQSQLSLAFKIGLEHLFNRNMYDPERDGLQQQKYSKFLYENNLRPLKLHCVSRLTVEFTSETVIFVLNGKSSLKRGENVLESWEKTDQVVSKQQSNKPDEVESDDSSVNFEEYKWPHVSRSVKSKQIFDSQLGQSWAPNINSGEEQIIKDSIYDKIDVSNHQMGRSSLVVWSNQQLKSQADFIEQKLLIAHSNELEPPKIKAKLIQLDSISLDTSNKMIANQLNNQFANKKINNMTNQSGHRKNDEMNLQLKSENYKPNDIVKFSCNPRYVLSEKVEVVKRVYSKWLINNKEITSNFINSFNGSSFFQNVSLISKRLKLAITNDDEGSLLIQFTTSLFQSKELNLKCQTIVEQQLIEFENQLILNILIGHRFVKQDSKFLKRKQVVGRGDGMKRGRNIITWPDNSTSSPNPYYKSFPRPKSSSEANRSLAHTIAINLLTILFVLSSTCQ